MQFETEILTCSWSWTFKLSVCKLMDKLCLHKIRPDKSEQAIGPDLQNTLINTLFLISPYQF